MQVLYSKPSLLKFILILVISLGLSACAEQRNGELGQPCFEGDKCFTGLICEANRCICESESDEELCQMSAAECGTLLVTDQCDNSRTISCGSCQAPDVCGGGGTENQCACVAPSDEVLCQNQMANCGALEVVDNCAVTRSISCGICEAPQSCGGAGTDNQCGCQSEDEASLCARENINCGSKTVVDNCGQMQIVDCGTCTAPETCGGTGTENQCGCSPESDQEFCIANGAQCGQFSGTDRCNQARNDIDCGNCTEGSCGGGGKNRCGDKFALINPGSFQQGSPETELGRDTDEGPRHVVSISYPFWVSKKEVTNLQWASLMMTAPSSFTGCGQDCPVESVNWWEAVSYANALSVSEGLPPCYELRGCNQFSPGENMICSSAVFSGLDCKGYRLPTEAEWEFVARAGAATSLPNGDLSNFSCANPDPLLDEIAWFCGNAGVAYSPCWNSANDITGSSTCAGTHPVGSKDANDWGVYDMIGNLWEWTNDWYGGYPASSVSNPLGPTQGTTKVVRGCAWSNGARFCRIASRNFYSTEYRFLNVGFRPVRTYSE